MYTTQVNIGTQMLEKILKDPEGFKRKRQNREYTAKEKQDKIFKHVETRCYQ